MVGKEGKSGQKDRTLKGMLPTAPGKAVMWSQRMSSEKQHKASISLDSPFHRWKEKLIPRDVNSLVLFWAVLTGVPSGS